MKRLLPLVLLGLLGCNLIPVPRPSPTSPETPSPPAPTASQPEAALGTGANPLILALAPSARPDPGVLTAGKTLEARLEGLTGYKIVAVIPPTETKLVEAFHSGNAHLGVLSPFGYLLASQEGDVQAAFARQRDGKTFYGAEFIVQSEAGFSPYYDAIKGENTADAGAALMQFNNKKPCWADSLSPSGYVVPLGFLTAAGIHTREPAFVAGHPTVVRAVYATGICDFGATYIDARRYPGLEDEFPDVMKKVSIVWLIPPIIPYETLVFARNVNGDMRRSLTRALVEFMSTDEGRSVMQKLYGLDAMQVVQDGQYAEFRRAVRDSGLDLSSLVK